MAAAASCFAALNDSDTASFAIAPRMLSSPAAKMTSLMQNIAGLDANFTF
jgi:hypothetical protein